MKRMVSRKVNGEQGGEGLVQGVVSSQHLQKEIFDKINIVSFKLKSKITNNRVIVKLLHLKSFLQRWVKETNTFKIVCFRIDSPFKKKVYTFIIPTTTVFQRSQHKMT